MKEKKIYLLCENSGYQLYEEIGINSDSCSVKKVPCAGRIEKDKILEYLNTDFDKVIIVSCFEGACHYVYGNARCCKKVQALKKDIEELGLNPEIIEFHNMAPNMYDEFIAVTRNLKSEIRNQ